MNQYISEFIGEWKLFFEKGLVPDHLLIVLMFILGIVTVLNFIGKKDAKTTAEDAPSEDKQPLKTPEVSWEKRLFKGLGKTRSEVWGKIGQLMSGKSLNDDLVEELEEVLYTADMSPAIVAELLEELTEKSSELAESGKHLELVKSFMKSKMVDGRPEY